jgi:anti-sigma regulatory factor (Ser/Thr protein kinase)
MTIDSDGNRSLYASLVLAVTDIIGHLLVAYKFNSSIFGFGVATSIGFTACLLAYFVHFLRKDRMLRFEFSDLFSGIGYLKDIFINGTPHGTEKLASATAGILLNHILAGMVSSDYIALYSVQKQFISFWGVSYQGVASTVYSLSGIFFGEEDRKALNILQKDTVIIGGKLVVALSAVIFIFPQLFFRIFLKANSAEVLSLGSELTRVLALTFPFYMLAFAFYKYLMGTKHVREANVYILLLQCVITVPVTFVALKCLGGRGIWFGNFISLVIMCIIGMLFIMFYKYGKTLNEKRLLLNEGFGTDKDKELVITASSLKTLLGMSRIAERFCKENGIDEIRANRFRLCLDEIGTNIITHGFDDGKKHMIDIRLLIKKDELIIRVRDDCRPFDPIERYNMTVMNKEDPTMNMGIRIVMNMSKDVQYHSANKTNNLIIKV